jgi:drug/metabolite transporter (DMT)-like permease
MKTFIIILVFGMLATGTINTLLNKFQDFTCVANCDRDPKDQKHFEQPLIQTLNMFLGEVLCLILYFIQTWRYERGYEPVANNDIEVTDESNQVDQGEPLEGYKHLWFLLPTLCDLTATTLMNIGLLFTSASVYQMLRGSVVLFTGTFSTFFLGIQHPLYRWIGLILVFFGVSIVGLSSLLAGSTVVTSTPLGIFLVVSAQSFTATQVMFYLISL